MKHTAIIMLLLGYTGLVRTNRQEQSTTLWHKASTLHRLLLFLENRKAKYLIKQNSKGAKAKRRTLACAKAKVVCSGLRQFEENDQICSRANSVWGKHHFNGTVYTFQPLIV
eukprot:4346942-Heterocapsa_arctica.AAC.1